MPAGTVSRGAAASPTPQRSNHATQQPAKRTATREAISDQWTANPPPASPHPAPADSGLTRRSAPAPAAPRRRRASGRRSWPRSARLLSAAVVGERVMLDKPILLSQRVSLRQDG